MARGSRSAVATSGNPLYGRRQGAGVRHPLGLEGDPVAKCEMCKIDLLHGRKFEHGAFSCICEHCYSSDYDCEHCGHGVPFCDTEMSKIGAICGRCMEMAVNTSDSNLI